MLIYNTTYHTSMDEARNFVIWLHEAYIPQVVEEGSLRNPRLVRVLSHKDPNSECFSLQWEVDDSTALHRWYVKQGEKLYLSAELEALSKAEQREAMESDEREGLVRLYLDTLLPEDWDGMDIFERRNFLTGSDFGDTQKHGTVKRTQVSNMEIWCECFGKERANIRRTDSNELTAILARLGWKRLDSKVRIPLYGPQYVFVPKECS